MHISLSDHFNYRKLLRFTFPSIIMMIFTSIYGVVDGLFVSNFVGKTPFAAINLIWPFLQILGCAGFMLGTGGSALVSKTMGEGKPDKANRYFSILILTTVVLGVAITVPGMFLMEPVAILLGADEAMLPYCVTYGRIILAAQTAFMLQGVFQSFLVTAERPTLGLIVTVGAGVTNMALDFLFIAVFDWGLIGAAVATITSQIVGGVIPLIYFLLPNKSPLRLIRPRLAPSEGARVIIKACTNGSSELMTNISMSVVSMLYNYQLMRLAGEDGIAAYGVMMYVSFVFVSVFIGYAIGSAPIVGFHYGAGNHGAHRGIPLWRRQPRRTEIPAPQESVSDHGGGNWHDGAGRRPGYAPVGHLRGIRRGAVRADPSGISALFGLLPPGRVLHFRFVLLHRFGQRWYISSHLLPAYSGFSGGGGAHSPHLLRY